MLSSVCHRNIMEYRCLLALPFCGYHLQSSLLSTTQNTSISSSRGPPIPAGPRRRTPLRTHLLKFLLNILSRSDPADTERPDDSRWAGQRRTDAMVESDWCVSDWCLRAPEEVRNWTQWNSWTLNAIRGHAKREHFLADSYGPAHRA